MKYLFRIQNIRILWSKLSNLFTDRSKEWYWWLVFPLEVRLTAGNGSTAYSGQVTRITKHAITLEWSACLVIWSVTKLLSWLLPHCNSAIPTESDMKWKLSICIYSNNLYELRTLRYCLPNSLIGHYLCHCLTDLVSSLRGSRDWWRCFVMADPSSCCPLISWSKRRRI